MKKSENQKNHEDILNALYFACLQKNSQAIHSHESPFPPVCNDLSSYCFYYLQVLKVLQPNGFMATDLAREEKDGSDSAEGI